jgi:hypothetical protein
MVPYTRRLVVHRLLLLLQLRVLVPEFIFEPFQLLFSGRPELGAGALLVLVISQVFFVEIICVVIGSLSVAQLAI